LCETEYFTAKALSMRSRVRTIEHIDLLAMRLTFQSDYKDDGTNILLDANENAYGPGLALNDHGHLNGTKPSADTDIDLLGLNRYPDPYAHPLHIVPNIA